MTTLSLIESKIKLCEAATAKHVPLPNMSPEMHQTLLNEEHERFIGARVEMWKDADKNYLKTLRALKVAMDQLKDIRSAILPGPMQRDIDATFAAIEKELK
jgi:hypothetical protein